MPDDIIIPDDTDTGDTATFDWKEAIPGGVPPVFSKYDSLDEAAKAHNQIHKAFSESQAKYKELEARLAKFESASKAQDKADAPATEPDATPDAPPAVDWRAAVHEYTTGGGLPPERLQELAKEARVDPALIGDMLEAMKSRREQYFSAAHEKYGDRLDLNVIEAWLASGKSPFSAEEIRAYENAAARGRLSWIEDALGEYEAFVEKGGYFEYNGQTMGAEPEFQRGRPAAAQPAHDGFSTKAEYEEAFRKAQLSGNTKEQAKVRSKLQATPERILSTWNRM